MTKSQCGPPCRELSERYHRFHLLYLMRDRPDWECYRDSASDRRPCKAQRRTCEVEASKFLHKPKMQDALRHHRDIARKIDEEKSEGNKAEASRLLFRIAREGAGEAATAGDAVRALAGLAKLHGWEPPKEVLVVLTPGLVSRYQAATRRQDAGEDPQDGDAEAIAEVEAMVPVDGG